jgi:hypothetical protein
MKEKNLRTVEEMSSFELSRWCALMEGVNVIADKCDDKGVDFNSIELEPLSLRKYVEGMCDSICKQIDFEKKRAADRKIASITAEQLYGYIFDDVDINESRKLVNRMIGVKI